MILLLQVAAIFSIAINAITGRAAEEGEGGVYQRSSSGSGGGSSGGGVTTTTASLRMNRQYQHQPYPHHTPQEDQYQEHDRRYLQWTEDPSFVSEPVFHYDGLRFNMDYRISTSIDPELVRNDLWTDTNCERPIQSDNPVMPYELLYDPPDDVFGDVIAGTRVVRVSSLIDPVMIVDARWVSHKVGKNNVAVNFCSTFAIKQDLTSADVAFTRENHFLMDVDVGGSSIVSYLEGDAIEESWQIDMYQCDGELVRIPDEDLLPIQQGQHVRLCVATANATRASGVYINNINQFTYQRADDGLVQNAITKGQVPSEDGSTQILCRAGNDLCAIDTVLSNSFFHSPGRIEGTGIVRLQFGIRDGDQRRRQRQLVLPSPSSPSSSSSQSTPLRYVRSIPLPHSTSVGLSLSADENQAANLNRRLVERGNIVTTLTAIINIDIEPSTLTYTAEAFRCDFQNQPVDKAVPVVYGEGVRICVRPNEEARNSDVYVRRLESFVFRREVGDTLVAINDDGVAADDGRTLVICTPGSEVCSIKTELADWFFVTKGVATVTGTAVLQFGALHESRRVRSNIIFRGLQETDNDPGFAGWSQVSDDFNVAYSTVARKNPRVWWSSSPPHLKFLYALAIAVGSLIVLCGLFGCCYFCFKRRQAKDFILNDVMDLNVKDTDDSIDAFADSKASYYSDLDFDTDYSGNSSDEESISEKFEEDLEDQVAILFSHNDEDLSQPLGLSSAHGPPPSGSNHRRSMPSHLSQSEHGPNRSRAPRRSHSQPLHGMAQSLHGPAGRGNPRARRPPDRLSQSEHIRGGRGPGPNRPSSANMPPQRYASLPPPRDGDPLRMSEHRRSSSQPPARDRLQTQSEHRPSGQRRPSLGPGPPGARTPSLGPGPMGQRRPSLGPGPPGQTRPSLGGRGPGGRGQGGRAPPQRTHSFQPTTRPSIQKNVAPRDRLSQSEHAHPKRRFPPPNSLSLQKGPGKPLGLSSSEHGPPKKAPAKSGKGPKGKKIALNKTIEYENGQHKNGLTQVPIVGKAPKKNIHPAKHAPRNEVADQSENNKRVSAIVPTKAKKKSIRKIAQPKQDNQKKADKPSSGKGPGSTKQKKGKVDSTQQSAATSATTMEEDSSSSDEGVRDEDVCFEADGHPGTDAFLDAVRATVKKFGPSAYSPKIYRHIKKQLPGRRFYICDDDDNLDGWTEVNKSQLIDLVWKYHR
jgi:hypothetical protein